MIETKIKVPEGMLKAAGCGSCACQDCMRSRLEAALLWQRENVQRPTDHEFGELVNACRESIGKEAWEKSTEWMRAGVLCHEWIRRMYDAPEPDVPEEIRDLLVGNPEMISCGPDERTLEAYRRGQKAGPK